MLNMYSMGLMGGGTYSAGGAYNASSGNVHQQLKARYSVGYEDVGTTPYAQPYPMPIIPRAKEPGLVEPGWLTRFLKRCFG